MVSLIWLKFMTVTIASSIIDMALTRRFALVLLAIGAFGLTQGCLLISSAPPRRIEGRIAEVQVEEDRIIVRIRTILAPERYLGSGADWIRVADSLYSGEIVALRRNRVIEYYVYDGMFVVEIDKSLITRSLTGFNEIGILLRGGGRLENYVYESDEFIWTIGEIDQYPIRKENPPYQ